MVARWGFKYIPDFAAGQVNGSVAGSDRTGKWDSGERAVGSKLSDARIAQWDLYYQIICRRYNGTVLIIMATSLIEINPRTFKGN